jgi:hypothetical protein
MRFKNQGNGVLFEIFFQFIIFSSSYSVRSNQSKRTVTYAPEILIPPPQYHPWETKYSQIFTREKIKKSMTKNPYTIMSRSIAHAIESITTQDECCPVLLPANAVHIDKPIVHQVAKSPRKCISLILI